MAITPDGAFAYVANSVSNTVSVIATATNTVVATVAGVGSMPSGVAITPDGAFAYVGANAGSTVSVIATATNTVVATVGVGSEPFGVAITPQVVIEVTIDIKPGSDPNSINPKSKGKIPVAILSTADFYAPATVDTTSLTFGRTGDELSLAFCNTGGEDVNGDGRLDLVCHFFTQKTGFQAGDTEGILRGQTTGGQPIEGRDAVRIIE